MKNLKVLFTVLCMLCANLMMAGSLVINTTNFTKPGSGSGYTPYNGTRTIDGIGIYSNQVMVQSSKIQFKKGSGVLYNTTAMPGNITKITFSTSNITIKVGTTENPSAGTAVTSGSSISGSYTYFSITATSDGTPSAATITIEYGSGKKSLSVTPVAGEQSITVDGSTLDVSTLFTVTDGYDGTPTYAIKSGNSYATLEGKTLTAVAAGSVTITCTAPETGNYGPQASNTKDVTVNVERTVTWYVNSEEYTTGDPTTRVNDGSKVTKLPDDPSVPAGCSGKVFVGWTTAKIETGSDTPPAVLFKNPANAPTVSGDNASYYAVFADEQ